jgi:hypothetical protein
MKRVLLISFSILIGLFASLLILESLLRFFPVNELLLSMPVNDENPVLRFVPNQTLTWSKSPNFVMKNTVHSNNYGFLNDQDYDPNDQRPLVAVIGDSYVEAAMVPYRETFQGILSRELAPEVRVYSFGRSGAPLSQYLAYARWASETFSPEKMIFIIVGNDFDESLTKYKRSKGFHFFNSDTDDLSLERIDYEPRPILKLLCKSHLFMYLISNVKILNLPQKMRYRFTSKPETQFAGNVRVKVDRQRIIDSKAATDRFFDLLPRLAGLSPNDVCFIIDGIRPQLYDERELETASTGFFGTMRNYFREQAHTLGYAVIDMQPILIENYKKNGLPFEFRHDGHWNPVAHSLAAKALEQSQFLSASHPDQ